MNSDYQNVVHGGISKYHAMHLLSELHSICSNMTFHLEPRGDTGDPQLVGFVFRIAKGSRQRVFQIMDELKPYGISWGFAAREIDSDLLSSGWTLKLSGEPTPTPGSAVFRRSLYNHLSFSTKNCQAKLEFTPSCGQNGQLGQINFVIVLNPGLLEKFEYSIGALDGLGVDGKIRLSEHST